MVTHDEPAIDTLLACCDVLVDGSYQEGNGDALRFRGSANQRIICLTHVIPVERINSGCVARVDMTLDSHGRFVIVGIPPRGFLKTFREKMVGRGLMMKDVNFSLEIAS